VGGQEDRARVGHALQPAFGHREHADLVDRAEAVLDGAHQAEAAVRVALEIQHRVDDVLQHARPGQRAFLGDVADQHDAGAAGLGRAREVRGAFAHLRHRAGGGVSWSEYTVWIESITPPPVARSGERGEDALQLDLRQHAHLRAVQAEAARAQRDLRAAFLAGDVQHLAICADSASSACSSSVDLPMPGSPPISTTPPSTMPPPSTRSSSSCRWGCARHVGWPRCPPAWPPAGFGQRLEAVLCPAGAGSATDSISVFQAPQAGHLPSHFGLVPPHSVQV
jgi:hypothetical protein